MAHHTMAHHTMAHHTMENHTMENHTIMHYIMAPLLCKTHENWRHTIEYCICIRRRGGIYGEIWPEPKGVSQGAAIFCRLSQVES